MVSLTDEQLREEVTRYVSRHAVFSAEDILASVTGTGVVTCWRASGSGRMWSRIVTALAEMKHAGRLREERSGMGFSMYHRLEG